MICPVCKNAFGGNCKKVSVGSGGDEYDCQQCGKFILSGSLEATEEFSVMSEALRAALSHRLQTSQSQINQPRLTTTTFSDFKSSWRMTTPVEQTRNLIEIIGNHLSNTGIPIHELNATDMARIGAISISRCNQIILGASELGLVRCRSYAGKTYELDLTLAGWREYEATKSGHRPGKYGFIAMKFGDAILEELCRDVIKPGIKELLNFDLVDLRDVARAGIIDNLMREQIRDSAFVLVDLTHDNPGAYWEAGYAEGLGKPVVYLCEQSKFGDFKTHFDTNHLTTVMWDRNDDRAFVAQLVATLKRSLGLFT